MVERCELATTYGAEAEWLIRDQVSGSLVPLEPKTREIAQKAINHHKDIHGEPLNVGYDSCTHLVEIGGGVHYGLPHLIHSLTEAITTLQTTLSQQQNSGLLSLSYHPTEDRETAYKNVVSKPIYDLWRGTYCEQPHLHPDVLRKMYSSKPEQGQGWQHEFTSLAASIQPWNSLNLANAADQFALIQATGWMFNLLTANSPFADREQSGKRDTRLDIWGPMLETSRYRKDHALARNLPQRPKGLSDYFHYIFSHQSVMAIPCAEVRTTGSTSNYKKHFRAVVQPADEQDFNVFAYLSAKRVHVVDIHTGQVERIKPSVAHIFNGYDFLYFPRGGARLRLSLPDADRIDRHEFVNAILTRNDRQLQKLLIQGGIKAGSICIEGRAPATVLPTRTKPTWQRFSIPFVLQTALLRSYKDIFALLDSTGLTWPQLTDELLVKTNDVRYGFQATIQGVQVTDLAQQIWNIAAGSLNAEERDLVGDEIDSILSNRQAPAEEQLELMKDVPTDASYAERGQAFTKLIDHCTAINPADIRATANIKGLDQGPSVPLHPSFAIPTNR